MVRGFYTSGPSGASLKDPGREQRASPPPEPTSKTNCLFFLVIGGGHESPEEPTREHVET